MNGGACGRRASSLLRHEHQQEVVVPLSEHEQRVLEQMEQAMAAEDPKFATAMRGSSPRARQRRRFFFGGLGLVLGLVLVMLGVAQSLVPLAVAGFVLMIAAGALAATPPRRAPSGPVGAVGVDGLTRPRRAKKKSASGPGTFMQRLENRWEGRRDQGRGWG
jgi:hypothetical protein